MTIIRSLGLIGGAFASIISCYGVSLRASSERVATVAAHERIDHDTMEMRLLRAELRTRSRLPELQRWNEQVLALAPPRAEQLVTNPVMLAGYAVPHSLIAPPAVSTVIAVVRNAQLPAPLLRRASFTPRIARDLRADAALAGGAAGIIKVGFQAVALR